ncbi:N-acetylmuramoyl-L-alanine amidase [Alkalibaculum sporogenes]|uniref:N-acetylmuramoyl-L-alanine amidase n=1 Tax=Alkalibaculum sporogenes TaxID=2655001 RepID=UPI00128B1269|nr:N-acetylmuramoyl-L-alanine amidase [Alkalibaculum sporogenes]
MSKNKIIIIFSIVLVFIIAIFINYNLLNNYNVTLQYPLSNKIIVIDPGHGGIDPGKVGLYGEDEKYINLKISSRLKELLESAGATVIMTREDNEGLYVESVQNRLWHKNEDMIKRRRLIRDSDGDIMVSIHMNSYPDSRIFGAQTFYLKGDESSEKLGKLVQEELVEISFKFNKREAKANDTYFILKGNDMPSLVIECGFLSNVEEEQMLNEEEYQKKLAWAILKGIVRYFYEQ